MVMSISGSNSCCWFEEACPAGVTVRAGVAGGGPLAVVLSCFLTQQLHHALFELKNAVESFETEGAQIFLSIQFPTNSDGSVKR